jgi:Na+-driven multidrug efflux pump
MKISFEYILVTLVVLGLVGAAFSSIASNISASLVHSADIVGDPRSAAGE